MEIKDYQKLPSPETCRLIDFDDAEIKDMSIDFHRHLVVRGNRPYINMKVSLNPRIYIARPDYWAIEIVGCVTGVALPVIVPYQVSTSIEGFIGKKGIEIVGATKTKKVACRLG